MSPTVPSCFVDTSIFRAAEKVTEGVPEHEVPEEKVRFGDGHHSFRAPHVRVWDPTGEGDNLRTLERLAREGRLRLCRSPQVGEELSGARGKGRSVKNPMLPEGRPFARPERVLERVPAPFERSHLFPEVYGAGLPPRKRLEEWLPALCRHLLGLDPAEVEGIIAWLDGHPDPNRHLTNLERTSLRDLARFRALCGKGDRPHLIDCFHLWTAEVNGLDYFLSTDTTFRRFVEQTLQAIPRAKMVTPGELLAELGVDPDPSPLARGRAYSAMELLAMGLNPDADVDGTG